MLLVSALVGLAAATIPALLVYVATRRRDAPTVAVAKEQAAISGAQAASEAWAEYAQTMERHVERAEGKLEDAEREIDSLKVRVAALETELDLCQQVRFRLQGYLREHDARPGGSASRGGGGATT